MRRVIAVAGLLTVSGQALAQDSVAQIPGGNDAMSAYGSQLVRYTVDLVPFQSSWGSEFVIGPAMKSSRSLDGGFNTQKIVGAVVSGDVQEHVSVPTQAYSSWSTRGAGVNASENAAPGSVNVGYFNRRFGMAVSDLGFGPTNILASIIGWRDAEPDRLYVERRVALSSRASAGAVDHSSLSLGSIDADGDVCVRADDFGIADSVPNKVIDENIVRVDSQDRDGNTNELRNLLGANISNDPAATIYFVNKSTVSLMPPAGLPTSKSSAADGAPIVFDFFGSHRLGGGTPLLDHLDPAIDAHRGAPSYSILSFGSGDSGSFGFLAISDLVSPASVDSLALATMNEDGEVVGTISATLPATLTKGLFTTNTPLFVGHLSQSSFRGGNGPVAIGSNVNNEVLLASTVRGDASDESIAVARFAVPIGNTAAQWSVAVHVGMPVLDGENGQQIGTIVNGSLIGSPVSLSSPAIDLLGNVYFVAAYKPTLGPARSALFKSVNTGSDYQLELLLQTGEMIVGANSTRPYQIKSLTLGDADSIASGSINSASVLQQRRLGAGNNPAQPDACGAVVCSAVIEYDNLAQIETYDAVLMIAPKGLEGLIGDINGDGTVNSSDLGLLIAAFGTANPAADINGDGMVDSSDLGLLIAHFGDSA